MRLFLYSASIIIVWGELLKAFFKSTKQAMCLSFFIFSFWMDFILSIIRMICSEQPIPGRKPSYDLAIRVFLWSGLSKMDYSLSFITDSMILKVRGLIVNSLMLSRVTGLSLFFTKGTMRDWYNDLLRACCLNSLLFIVKRTECKKCWKDKRESGRQSRDTALFLAIFLAAFWSLSYEMWDRCSWLGKGIELWLSEVSYDLIRLNNCRSKLSSWCMISFSIMWEAMMDCFRN